MGRATRGSVGAPGPRVAVPRAPAWKASSEPHPVLVLPPGSDLTPVSFQPFNHGHKVAKFCYADKVSPGDFGVRVLSLCWPAGCSGGRGRGQIRFPSGHGCGRAVGAVGTESVPGRACFAGPGVQWLTRAQWELLGWGWDVPS